MIRVYRLFLLFLSLFSIVNSSEQQRAGIEVFAPRNPQHLFTFSYSDGTVKLITGIEQRCILFEVLLTK